MPKLAELTVSYNDVQIVVREATAQTGLTRRLRKAKVFEAQPEREGPLTPEETAISWLSLITFVDLVSAAVEYHGMSEPGLGEFLELPEILVDKWAEATYRLNPHWRGRTEEEREADEKKAS